MASENGTPGRRRRWRRLILVFVGLAVLSELALVVHYRVILGKVRAYRYDSIAAWNNAANLDGPQPQYGRSVHVRTDDEGRPLYRVTPTAERGPHVLLLGDSFAFGLCADTEESFGAAMAQVLAESGQVRSFVNYGVPNYGTDQAYLRYASLPRLAEPQLVVYLMYENDLYDNVAPISGSRAKPHFALDSGGNLEQVGSANPLDALRDRLFLAHYALFAWGRFRQDRSPPAGEPQALWRAIVQAWQTLAAERGDRLLIVYHESPQAALPSPTRTLVAGTCEELGLPWLELNRVGAIQEADLAHDRVHWSAAAQQRLGEMVARWLLREYAH